MGGISCASAPDSSSNQAGSAFFSEDAGIFAYNVGEFEVFMLVDARRSGTTEIIPSARSEIISRYIPEDGFTHSTNVFIIKTPENTILIDTGFGNSIFEKMESLGINPEDIDAVLLTHLHGDHIGGLQRDGQPVFTNAKIYLDQRERNHFTVTAPNQSVIDALNAYGSNVVTFNAGTLGRTNSEILPGITAIASYGHTPGHTSFIAANGGDRLIITGDFLHVALVQFPHPEISATFDRDQDTAAAVRRQILEYAANNRIPVGGMHIVYPGIVNVEAEGNGFRAIPVVR